MTQVMHELRGPVIHADNHYNEVCDVFSHSRQQAAPDGGGDGDTEDGMSRPARRDRCRADAVRVRLAACRGR